MARQQDYTDEQLAEIVEDARRSGGFFDGKYLELLYFAMFNDDSLQKRALFARVVRRYVYSCREADGSVASPREFNKEEIKREMEVLERQTHRRYRFYFGIATVDGAQYLPKNITIDRYKYKRVSWRTVWRELMKRDKKAQFLNAFARTVRPVDVMPFADDRILKVSSEDFYNELERLLKNQVYYCTEIEAIDAEVATEIIDATFGKVLWAATAVWAMTSQGATWNSSGLLTRRAPAMMSGVYLAIDGAESENELIILQDTERKVKAEQALLSGTNIERDKSRLEQYRQVLAILRNVQGNCARERLVRVTRTLHAALTSDDAENRHLKLWQCVEFGVGWRKRREIDMVNTIKHYYDPSVAANEAWKVMGDYVHVKRCIYVHEGMGLTWDAYGTYDSALNLYMDYVRVVLMLLKYFGDAKRTQLVNDEQSFKKLMEYYAQDNKDLVMAKWVVGHRYRQ